MKRRLTGEEIIANITAEETVCLGSENDKLASEREKAMNRYRGMPLGNEVPDRSQVVSRDSANQIEWIIPSLVRVFLGSDEIGQFTAIGPEDEEQAKLETDTINWYLTVKSDYFSHIVATLKDALILKNGYLICYWKKEEHTDTETYIGKHEDEVAMLMQDPEVSVIEHTERMDPVYGVVHDVKVERKASEEYLAIESVPPDEIRVSRRHRWTSLLDCEFVQWKRRTTIGQLRADGFDVPDDAGANSDTFDAERIARNRFGEQWFAQEQSLDPTRRQVVFKETFCLMDIAGKGTGQLWRVCHIDGDSTPLRVEEADIIPLAAFSPMCFPHSHVGISIDDLICDLSDVDTTLLRQFLDNIYLLNNGRTAVSDGVNLDDMLISRPGGIVRVEGLPGDKIMPLATPDVSASVLQGLEYVNSLKEQRTGVTRYSAGLDANTLNKTATGIQSIQSAANQRIEMIARNMASGFRDLMVIAHALVRKHCSKAVQVKLNNTWQTIDPRTWTRRTDFSVDVGLGIGAPDAQLMKLQSLAPLLAQATQTGLAGPQEMYNFGAEILKAAGYKNPDKFLKAPPVNPQTGQAELPPPPPPPEVQVEQMRQQGAAQKAQMTLQAEGMKFQAEQQAEAQRMTAEQQAKAADRQMEYELQRTNDERAAALEMQKHQDNMQLQREKIILEAQTAIEVAKINRGLDDGLNSATSAIGDAGARAEQVAAAIQSSLEQAQAMLDARLAQHQALVDQMAAHAQAIQTPKRIVRDPMTGRAVGLEPVRTLQ